MLHQYRGGNKLFSVYFCYDDDDVSVVLDAQLNCYSDSSPEITVHILTCPSILDTLILRAYTSSSTYQCSWSTWNHIHDHSLEAFLIYKNYVYHTYILRSIVRLKYIFRIIIYLDYPLTTSTDNECILTKHFIKEYKTTVVMICSHFQTLNQPLNSACQGPCQYIINKIPLFIFGFNYLLFWKPFSF